MVGGWDHLQKELRGCLQHVAGAKDQQGLVSCPFLHFLGNKDSQGVAKIINKRSNQQQAPLSESPSTRGSG